MDTMTELVGIRKKKGLLQKDIARKMGIGQPAVSELERGNTSPKVDTLRRYAAALGHGIEIFVVEVDDGE